MSHDCTLENRLTDMFLRTRAETPGLMEWGKLYASLPDEPRVQAVEDKDGAGWLIIQSIGYLTRVESDGFIPHTQVPRFGGPRLKQRVAALVRERIYIEVDGGYEIDPALWNEERNLSDQAERKKKADRDRIAAKRAAAQNGSGLSRDSRATDRATQGATSRRDSRALEKRREEKKDFVADVVTSGSDRNARAFDDSIIKTIIESIYERTDRVVSPEWAAKIAGHILGDRPLPTHPDAYVRAAIEREPDPRTRFLSAYGDDS
jgi:hypothetical protein